MFHPTTTNKSSYCLSKNLLDSIYGRYRRPWQATRPLSLLPSLLALFFLWLSCISLFWYLKSYLYSFIKVDIGWDLWETSTTFVHYPNPNTKTPLAPNQYPLLHGVIHHDETIRCSILEDLTPSLFLWFLFLTCLFRGIVGRRNIFLDRVWINRSYSNKGGCLDCFTECAMSDRMEWEGM